jgi:hypothetical protein
MAAHNWSHRGHSISENAVEQKELMAHRHLILAYVFTILVQLGYAGWVGLKYWETRKLEREFPPYPSTVK